MCVAALVTAACSSGSHKTTPAVTTTEVVDTTTSTASSTTTTTASGPLAAVAGKVILLDPGHNGGNYKHPEVINKDVDAVTQQKPCDTTGTETNDGYTEPAYTFDVAVRMRSLLESAGATVVMTRPDNSGVGPCITERAAIGNRAHAAVGISIHADGGPPSGRGFHVIEPAVVKGHTEPIVEPSRRLGTDLRAAYETGTSMPRSTYIGKDGIDVRDDLGGLNWSTIPKVFIETGNMRNATDAALLKSADFRQKVAVALCNGVADFLAGR
ncbi:MAG: N-acetylmuramoyl-L-alanine amidase [Actinobacteria bacterium]|nr:N-acetylmuramoyl-L-alanine amidase [Actinomycetota bacterium]